MAVFTATALIGALAAGGFATATGVGIFGTAFTAGTFGAFAIGFAGSLAMSTVTTALSPHPKAAAFAGLGGNPTQQVKQPITARQVIYGECRLSGPITYVATCDGTRTCYTDVGHGVVVALPTKNSMLHSIIALAGHECQKVGTIYLNDDALHTENRDSDGFVLTGDYWTFVRLRSHLGGAGQTADTMLLFENADVDSTFVGTGTTYMYNRLRIGEPNRFTSGIPNMSADVQGRLVYDPRDAGTRWSPNPALCLRDYLKDNPYGLGASADEIDDSYITSAANSCEEIVTTKSLAMTVTAVDQTNEFVTFGNDDVLLFETGDRIVPTSTGTVPSGLTAGTSYYAIVAHRTNSPAVKFATSYANALAGTAVNLSSAGSGTITVTKTGEPRFTCNGTFGSDQKPVDILANILGSMGGRMVFGGGKWRVYAAVWNAPSVEFNEDDLRGQLTTQTRHSRRDRFNAVQGTYIAAINNAQPTNYPSVTNTTWQNEDGGERVFTQLDMPFTNRPQTAQRLAKIELERHRRQISADIVTDLSGLLVQAGDNLSLTFANNGWASKSFEVVKWSLTLDSGGNGPTLGVSMSLREVDAACFTFDESTDEVIPAPAPATNLGDPFTVEAPTTLVLTSGTAVLDIRLDGSVFSRIKAAWMDADDSTIARYEVQAKKTADTDWRPNLVVPTGVGYAYILDVKDGVSYDVRVRAGSLLGLASDWLTSTGHTVAGKSAAPSDVSSVSAQQNGSNTNIAWVPISDPDIGGYVIRYMAAPFVWDNANDVTRATRGTKITNGFVPPGAWVIGIKAVDTSGNESATAATTSITITNTNSVIFSYPQAPDWLGTITNGVKHDVSGRLVMKAQDTVSANDFVVFDVFVTNPYATMVYQAAEIDVGFDALQMRVYAESNGGLGFGESGTTDVQLAIDHHLSSDSYDGFEDWTIGLIDARYLKYKATMTAANGVGYMSVFTPVADAEERTESGTVTVASGAGTAVTFGQVFHAVPKIAITPRSSTALIGTYDGQTTAGFTAHLFTTAGVGTTGTADWQAVGV